MRSILALLIVIAVVFITPACAEDSALASLFSDAGIDGTILIARLDGSERYVHNEQRAARRLPAASTFKIFNTLIALDEGAVSGLDEVIRWDGHLYDFPDWNQDHTIKSAYPIFVISAARCAPKPRVSAGAERVNYTRSIT